MLPGGGGGGGGSDDDEAGVVALALSVDDIRSRINFSCSAEKPVATLAGGTGVVASTTPPEPPVESMMMKTTSYTVGDCC